MSDKCEWKRAWPILRDCPKIHLEGIRRTAKTSRMPVAGSRFEHGTSYEECFLPFRRRSAKSLNTWFCIWYEELPPPGQWRIHRAGVELRPDVGVPRADISTVKVFVDMNAVRRWWEVWSYAYVNVHVNLDVFSLYNFLREGDWLNYHNLTPDIK
jgi:hypothetical protein